jgi:predicted ArsR family transcriptional regulator
VSVAEVAAELGVPLGTARVLVSDLYAEGLLVIHLPSFTRAGRPRTEVLERLLTGLRAR